MMSDDKISGSSIFYHEHQEAFLVYNALQILVMLQAYNAKISDFGLAKLGPSASQSHVTTRVMGTYGYAAPEYVATGDLAVFQFEACDVILSKCFVRLKYFFRLET